jgi:transposase
MSQQLSPSDDLDAKPFRRTYTAEYKARILAEYEAATSSTERGAILRREKLYSAHIRDWRRARDTVVSSGLTDRRLSAQRAKKTAEQAEIVRLRKQCSRLERELARKDAALTIMGKAHALLELLSESADTDPTSNRF